MAFRYGEPRKLAEWLKYYRYWRKFMQITVKFVNPANEGKKYGSVVSDTDKKYMVKASQVGRFIKGSTYEIELHPEEWGDTTVHVVDSIQAVQNAPQSIRKPNGDRWYMPFVSNTVAHAIAAGCIKDFGELNQWAKAAHDAAIALDALDDDISQ